MRKTTGVRPWPERWRRTAAEMHLSQDLRRLWGMVIRRCYDPRHPSWQWYGGRGIRVCDEWRSAPEPMFEHVGPRPTFFHQLDRIDNDGHYAPGNVRWATPRENSWNRPDVKLLEYGGIAMPAKAWARAFEISPTTMRNRLSRGWSLDEIAEAVEMKKEYITCP